MPIKQIVKDLLRDCPDGRLRVLIALAYFVPAPTAIALADDIPMNRKTVGGHLHGLADDGYVWNKGQRWYLTSKVEQLGLPLELSTPVDKSEASSLTLPCSSSSYLIEENSDYDNLLPKEQQLLLQQVPQSEASSPTLQDTYRVIENKLVDQLATPRKVAHRAALACQTESVYPSFALYQISLWQEYIRSGHGRGIHNPPLFIATKLERGEWLDQSTFRPDRRQMDSAQENAWQAIDRMDARWQKEISNEQQPAE